MDATHFHLALNHFPLVGMIIGTMSLIYAIFFSKNRNVAKNFALMILVLSAISVIPVYFLGEATEDLVENISGVSENSIEEHEEIGKVFAIGLVIIGGVSLVMLLFDRFNNKKEYSKYLNYAVLFGCVVVCGLAIKTGNSGGEIRHIELNTNSNLPGYNSEKASSDDEL